MKSLYGAKPSANDLFTRLRAKLAAQVHVNPPDGQLPPREAYAAVPLFQCTYYSIPEIPWIIDD